MRQLVGAAANQLANNHAEAKRQDRRRGEVVFYRLFGVMRRVGREVPRKAPLTVRHHCD
jgi:hypothetical protein